MLSRRELLEGAAGVAALVAVGGIGTMDARGSELLRPPGAQDEDRLFGACIRCDRCRSACDRDVIGVGAFEDGIMNLRMPKLDFRRGYCDTCEGAYRCREVCPVGAIGFFDTEKDKLGVAEIDYEHCLTYGISGGCSGKCVDKCPEEALSISETGRLLLDQSLCWGCGACEYYCPSDSYGAYSGSSRRGINVVKWEADERER